MRGVAALAVVCGHALTMRYGMGFEPTSAMNALLLLQGGVDIFFVISGFIITLSAIEAGRAAGRMGAVEFGLKRFLRIFPVYWLVLAAAIVSARYIDVFPRSAEFSYEIDWRYIFTLTTANWYVAPAWSLCFELYFYAAAAAIILIFPRHVMLTLLAALAIVVVADIFGLPLRFYSEPLVLEFGLGVVVAVVTRAKLVAGLTSFSAASLSLCFFVTGWYLICNGMNGVAGVRLLTYGFGSALLVYAVVNSEAHGGRFPRWMQFIGTISYSLYLSHHLLLTWLSRFDVPDAPGPLVLIGWIVAALLLAASMHYLIERPAIAAGRWLAAALLRRRIEQREGPHDHQRSKGLG